MNSKPAHAKTNSCGRIITFKINSYVVMTLAKVVAF